MSIQTLLQHFRENVKYGSEDSIMIHIHITEGNNLLSADNNGYSDPYFKIKIDDAVEKKQSTDHHPVTLNPVYHDVHTFVLNSSTLQGDITIEAMDYDRVSANDSLGFAVIPLRDLLTIGAISGWYGLFQTPKCGANERNPGRFYVRMVLDKDRSDERKKSKSQFETHRAKLLDLVRQCENEQTDAIRKTVAYHYQQVIDRAESLPPPPPSSGEENNDAPNATDNNDDDDEDDGDTSGVIPSIEYFEIDPKDLQSPVDWKPTSPSFISSPFHYPDLPVVPLQQLNPKTYDGTTTSIVDLTSYPAVAHKVSLCCASWNVGNSQPPEPHKFRHWLKHDSDIYVVSTQENSYQIKDTTSAKHFLQCLTDALGFNYELVESADLGQIYLHIFAKRTIRPIIDVYQSQKSTEATGFGNVISNKGGAAVALSILGNSFVFVSSHLAAHTHMVDARNKDMWEIVNGINWKGNSGVNLLSGFHHIFWMGDLNYRLEYAGSDMHPDKEKWDEMVQLINQNKFKKIFKTDQLTREMKSGNSFVGFNDCPPITFKPTFKVKKGIVQPEYDPKRTPSYTDRVLYKSQRGFESQIVLKSFESSCEMDTSDHKPVAAYFHVYPTTPMPSLYTSTKDTSPQLQLVFKHIQCSDLPVGDLNGLSDPFIKICSPAIKGNSIKTSVKKNTLHPVWNEKEIDPVHLTPNTLGRLWETLFSVLIYDKDFGSRSLLCSGAFSFKEQDVFSLFEGKQVVSEVILSHPQGAAAGKMAIIASLNVIPAKSPLA